MERAKPAATKAAAAMERAKPATRGDTQAAAAAASSEVDEEDGLARDDKYRMFVARMRKLMEKYPQEQREGDVLMKLVNGMIHDTRRMAAEEARRTVQKDADILQCAESVMMYNVHKIKFQDAPIYEVSTFEEKLTDEINHLTRGRVQATRISVMQRAENGKPMTVKVKLGSQQQRGMLYKMLGVAKKFVPESQAVFAGVAFRDCFPFDLLPEVRRLSGEGMEAKRHGECVAFRVTSTGGGSVPVLQVRKAYGERWSVYVRNERKRAEQRPRSLERGMEVEGDEEEVSNLWHEMPTSFTKREVSSDPEFRVRVNRSEAMMAEGEGQRALVEWRADMVAMAADIGNFQGRDIVKGRMQEIYDAYWFTFERWCDKVGLNPLVTQK
jgi:hypothetical protein